MTKHQTVLPRRYLRLQTAMAYCTLSEICAVAVRLVPQVRSHCS